MRSILSSVLGYERTSILSKKREAAASLIGHQKPIMVASVDVDEVMTTAEHDELHLFFYSGKLHLCSFQYEVYLIVRNANELK